MKGVHVVVRYVDEWIDSSFDERNTFAVGTKKTITAWAVEGFCEKNEKGILRTNIENFI